VQKDLLLFIAIFLYLDKEHLQNNWCPPCQEQWESNKFAASRGGRTRIQCPNCHKDDSLPGRWGMEDMWNMICLLCKEKEQERKWEKMRAEDAA